MLDQLQTLIGGLGLEPNSLLLAGLGLGVLVAAFGMSGAFAGQSAQSRRMHALAPHRAPTEDFDLIRGDDNDPNGLLKAFVPTSRSERTAIARRLRQGGIQRKNAVLKYYLSRTILGLLLPALYVGLLLVPPQVWLDIGYSPILKGRAVFSALPIVAGLAVLGFYLPVVLLWMRIRARRKAIWENLPNALDLLQVSVEAGLGFDAAMVRVAHEMAVVAPAISEEFMMLELEIQAGKDRQRAFLDMADRTAVPEVGAFANVILQAAQFGTSVSSALTNYASEMRIERELRAQQRANKLPVQMSAIMALFMMPALLMICLTPMVIRWMRMFPG